MEPVLSPILLCCLTPPSSKSSNSPLTCENLFLIFSVFSPMKKIMIFRKTPILKAFLEFSSPEGAQLSMDSLHNRSLDDLGYLQLFPSPLEKISFSPHFPDCRDFSNIERNVYLRQIKEKLKIVKKPKDQFFKIDTLNDTGSGKSLSVVDEESEQEGPLNPRSLKKSFFDSRSPELRHFEEIIKMVNFFSKKF